MKYENSIRERQILKMASIKYHKTSLILLILNSKLSKYLLSASSNSRYVHVVSILYPNYACNIFLIF